MRTHVVSSVVKRELAGYFSNPTGYVFITLFVFLSGVAAFWVPEFFDRNLANLDQLNRWFGVLLLFLIPAITMGAWAEERKQGTEELLLTLPARPWELVFGKYLGCVAIYGVALLFAASHVLVLGFLGRPDPGMMLANYLGYLLSGAALTGVGLAASTLTARATIAFILAAVACGFFVGAGLIERMSPGTFLGDAGRAISVPVHLESFGRGVIDLGDAVYFVVLAVAGVWAAVHAVNSRGVGGTPRQASARAHGLTRLAALAVGGAALVMLADRSAARMDATAERLWSVSPQTRKLLAGIPADRPVVVSAYVSRRVPGAYVQVRETLLGMLHEMASISAGRLQLHLVDAEPFSEEAREAERAHGIKPRTVPADSGGMGASQAVFLGVSFTGSGGAEQTTIPFLSRGLPVEYELARAIRRVSGAATKKVGVLETEAALFGKFDFQTFSPGRDWPIVDELRKQYEVVRVSPAADVPADVSVLLVAQPSTLRQDELERVLVYLRSGRGAIILEDPLPVINPALATAEPRRPQNPMMGGRGDEGPKVDLKPLWDLLGARIASEWVVWDTVNPNPMLRELPNEFIWITRPEARGARDAFNDSQAATRGLQEAVLLFPGLVETSAARPGESASGPSIVPLLRSSPTSGRMAYAQVMTRNPFGMATINPARRPIRMDQSQTLAARVTGRPAGAGSDAAPINAILVGDLDMISEDFFSLRESGAVDLELDNVPFILNAVDVLAGDESLVELRNRRRAHRTLERVEARRQEERRGTLDAEERARAEAENRLAETRGRFDAKIKEIDARADVDETTRRIMAESVRRGEQRKLDAQSAAIEDQRRKETEAARLATKQKIDSIQMTIRLAAVALPPIPALALGAIVFLRRRGAESASRIGAPIATGSKGAHR
ncbi:MAG: Gldg family protein [Phycisphaerae bacterium]|nr:Gldg family protein [Phycisphaerae bacterium]